ncbi:MAG TPA: hypothetical protein VLZ05_14590 [Mycobacterium sp.]|nr:hypothetical protein [Mycobacterium sp.]HUH69967.1 hypothetical protein [Mycobacterium sp.]
MLLAVAAAERAGLSPAPGHLPLDGEAVLSSWQESFDAPPWDGPGVWVHGDLLPGKLVLRVLMRPLDVYRGEDGSYRFEACASADPESVEATLEVSSGCWRDPGGVDR